MSGNPNIGWDPKSATDWERHFGFVASNLFPRRGDAPGGAVLRDGRFLSFTLLSDGTGATDDQDALSWSWSAHTRFLVRPRDVAEKLVIHRWDQPSKPIEELSLGEIKHRPARVLDLLRRAHPAREQDVIQHVIQVFRSLRSRVEDPETAIRLLHHMLRPGDAIGESPQLRSARHVADVDGLRERLLRGNERLGLTLHSELLLRHAASELFQEAHVEADRQVYFFGMSPPARIDKIPPEVRYTPSHLARVLAEIAFSKLSPGLDEVRVLDPACGSGVFLTEVEPLKVGDRRPRLQLHGYDTSAVAVELAQCCTSLAASTEDGSAVQHQIERRNSLTDGWVQSDVILMNPPFRAYPDMDKQEREAVSAILGDLAVGRPDKALAFLWKAWLSLNDSGVLATVLPASVLAGEAGRKVREEIHAHGTLHVIGRFESHVFFRHSLIETGFVVIKKTTNRCPATFITVVATDGKEDDAIRSLRLLNAHNEKGETCDVYRLATEKLAGADWFPRRRAEYDTIAGVLNRGFPAAGHLFTISQGMRTGLKEAFVLTAAELARLPKNERGYFRPAAGQGTIRDGRLSDDLYAFYPYTGAGRTIASERELMRELPVYASHWLKPVKHRLTSRKKIKAWYLPTWPRNWQFLPETKLVSTYFGQEGSFAVDAAGMHVVVDGHNWMLKGRGSMGRPEFTKLLYAYCALLNSTSFQSVLRIYARSLQGGQLRLEPRFINTLPLPDLRQPELERVLLQLADLGERIAKFGFTKLQVEVDSISRAIYGE